MSIIDEFSPSIFHRNDKNDIENHDNLLNIKYINRTSFANVINDLCEMGYDINSISYLLEEYKFSNVDEAINFFSKNKITNKYNHKFYPLKRKSYCGICKDNIENHENINYYTIDSNSNYNLNTNNSNENSYRIESEIRPFTISINSIKSNHLHHKTDINYNNIKISKETQSLFDNPNICTICYENLINKNNVSHLCNHFFCDKCMKTYLTYKIKNGDVLNIKCLLGGCQRIYSNSDIKRNVNPKMYLKYKQFKYQKLLLTNPNKYYVQCPYPDCNEIVEVINFQDEFIECKNKHYFCYKCRSLDFHRKYKCQNEDKKLLEELYNNYDSKKFKQCPRCKILIEKNSGCNEIKCINCGYKFCWLCLEECTPNHYRIYNISGCPGLKNKGNEQNNCCLNCLWYFFSCILAFFLAIFVIIFYFCFGCCYEFNKCYLRSRKSKGNCLIIILLIILGIICQPVFFVFYVTYGLFILFTRYKCCLWCCILKKSNFNKF